MNPLILLRLSALCALGALSSAPALAAQGERWAPQPGEVVLATSVHRTEKGTNAGGADAQKGSGAGAGAGSSVLRPLEQAWRANPQAVEPALAYARALFLLGLTEGDLRWYGSAKAVLQPWWNASALTADGHFMRALIRQGFHDFSGSLTDLDAAIALQAQRPEFWSWRFALHLLLSQMDAARADAQEIRTRFGANEARVYDAILNYRSGRAQASLSTFEALSRSVDYQAGTAQDWLNFHWGEALRAAGQSATAIRLWESHLRQRPNSHNIRANLADVLNQEGHHAQALQVSQSPSPTDALLVQSLLAQRGLKNPVQEAALDAKFASRLQAQALRQETLIERPRMVYLIRYGKDVRAGLALAQANWRDQQEPADAQLLLEAALALQQVQAAQPVFDWMQKTGYTDPALARLKERLQALPSAGAGVARAGTSTPQGRSP